MGWLMLVVNMAIQMVLVYAVYRIYNAARKYKYKTAQAKDRVYKGAKHGLRRT